MSAMGFLIFDFLFVGEYGGKVSCQIPVQIVSRRRRMEYVIGIVGLYDFRDGVVLRTS